MFENQTSDFEDDTGTQAVNGLRQETFDVATGILNAVKSTFNVFTDMGEQLVKFGWILQGLVGPFGGPDTISSMLANVGLPIVANKALVAKDVTVTHTLQNDLSRLTLVSIGGYQIIDHWQAIQRGQHDQFVAKVVE